MKNELSSIPKLPYKKITQAEDDEIRAYFKQLGRYDDDEFWQQTQEEGRKVAWLIKEGGFVVGGEVSFGTSIEGGRCNHVYPKNYTGDMGQFSQKGDIIGRVGLWASCGFHSSNPVQIWYQNPDLVDDSLELRNYLLSRGISFDDLINLENLKRQIVSLETERLAKQRMLSKLEGLELRTQ